MDYAQDSKCWYEAVCNHYGPECQKSCIRYAEMSFLVENSGIPESRWFPTVLDPGPDYKKFIELADIKDNIVEFVTSGQNLYITSEHTGNGKTSWAIKLLLKYFDQIWAGNGFCVRGMFIHIPALLLQLKNFSDPLSEEYKRNILECDLIVWDELAYSGLSSYDYSNLLMFLENRILSGKANIFTSNRDTKEKLDEVVGSKLSSRIWQTSKIIQFKGKDRR